MANKSSRNLGLDALRGLAALAVALTHFSYTYYSIYGAKPLMAVDLGSPAVALFFVISGYVILMTLERSKTVSDFAIARFARLYPVFWVSVALTFTVVHIAALPGRETSVRDALLNLTMVPSVFAAAPVDVVYWSLTVEVFFYIIAGTIFAFGLRKYLVPVLSTLLIAGVVDHFWPISRFRGGYRIESMLILPWWPLFLFGITFYRMQLGIRRSHLLTISLCVAASLLTGWRYGILHCGLALAVFLATRFEHRVLNNRLLIYFGAISYSFYLTHCNIGYCLIRVLNGRGMDGWLSEAITLAVTTGIATAVCYLVERPSNRFVRELLLRGKPRAERRRGAFVVGAAGP